MKFQWNLSLKIVLCVLLTGAGVCSIIWFNPLVFAFAVLVGYALILSFCPIRIRRVLGIIALFLIWLFISFGPLTYPWIRMNLAFQAKAIAEDVQTLLSLASDGRIPGPEPGFSQGFLETVEQRLKLSNPVAEDTLALGWVGLLGESPRALDKARDLVKRYPRFSPGRLVFAYLLFQTGTQGRQEAYAQLDMLSAMDSLNAAPFVCRASMEWEDDQREQAVRDLLFAGKRPFYLPYNGAIIRAKWRVLERTGFLDVRTKALALNNQFTEIPLSKLMAVTDTAIQAAEAFARNGKREEAERALRTIAGLGEKMYDNPLEYGDWLGWRIKQKALRSLIANGFLSTEEEQSQSTGNSYWNALYAIQVSSARPLDVEVLRIAILLWVVSSIAVVFFGLFSIFQRKIFGRALLVSGLIASLAMGCFSIKIHPLIDRQQVFLNASNPDKITYALVPLEVFGLMSGYCPGGI
jgi:hypothetical protein